MAKRPISVPKHDAHSPTKRPRLEGTKPKQVTNTFKTKAKHIDYDESKTHKDPGSIVRDNIKTDVTHRTNKGGSSKTKSETKVKKGKVMKHKTKKDIKSTSSTDKENTPSTSTHTQPTPNTATHTQPTPSTSTHPQPIAGTSANPNPTPGPSIHYRRPYIPPSNTSSDESDRPPTPPPIFINKPYKLIEYRTRYVKKYSAEELIYQINLHNNGNIEH